MSQPRKSHTGEQKRFMQAVSSHGYGGESHANFKYTEARIITSEPNSLTE